MLEKLITICCLHFVRNAFRLYLSRVRIGHTGIAIFVGMVGLSTLSARAGGPYGDIELRQLQSRNANPQIVLAAYNKSLGELGPQSAPSASRSATNPDELIILTGQRYAGKPVRSSYERLLRGRIMPAMAQEDISPSPDSAQLSVPRVVIPTPPEPQEPQSSEASLLPSNTQPSLSQPIQSYQNATGLYQEEIGGDQCLHCGHGFGNQDSPCSCGVNQDSPCSVGMWCRFDIFAGVTAFNNALNYAGKSTSPWSGDGSGSFGFQEGFQWSDQIPGLFYGELGSQFGLRAIQANLSGAEFTTDTRNQLYLTAGLFRRVDYGIQGGVAVDYLAERWYLNTDLVQVRSELSYLFNPYQDFGFRAANGVQSSNATGSIHNDSGALVSTTASFSAVDQYRFFYRHHLCEGQGAKLEGSLGWTEQRNGLLAAMIEAPLTPELWIQSSFTYAVPSDSVTVADHQSELWNAGLMLIWTPSVHCRSARDYYRPLFQVADPGSFLVGLYP